MWEGACPRWQCVSQCISKLTHRYREQAPSHILTDVSSEVGGTNACAQRGAAGPHRGTGSGLISICQ
ncbi:hypothetical protein CUU62_23635 [Pseudomonas sp. WP001]|nr:hypothetical protein CUU62_23635 [Pseudomonas sp. WP001]